MFSPFYLALEKKTRACDSARVAMVCPTDTPTRLSAEQLCSEIMSQVMDAVCDRIDKIATTKTTLRSFIEMYRDGKSAPLFPSLGLHQVMALDGCTYEDMQRFLRVTVHEAAQFLRLPLDPLKKDTFVASVQYHIFNRCPFFRMDDFIWVVVEKKMLTPISSKHFSQFLEKERDKSGFNHYHFFRSCFYRILYFISNFTLTPEILPPFIQTQSLPPWEEWVSKKTFCSAMQKRWSYVTILLNSKDHKSSSWWPVRQIFLSTVPDDVDPLLWKRVFNEVALGTWNFEKTLKVLQPRFQKAIFDPITVLYLDYTDKSVLFRTVPSDISEIRMFFSDQCSDRPVHLDENLLFYAVSAAIFSNAQNSTRNKDVFLKYILANLSAFQAESLSTINLTDVVELLRRHGVRYDDGFIFENFDRHVFIQNNIDGEALRPLLQNLTLSSFWLDVISQRRGTYHRMVYANKEFIYHLIPLLRVSGILKLKFFQQSMVDVARSIFLHSKVYLGISLIDHQEESRKHANKKTAEMVTREGFVPVDPKHKHRRVVFKELALVSDQVKNKGTVFSFRQKTDDIMGRCERKCAHIATNSLKLKRGVYFWNILASEYTFELYDQCFQILFRSLVLFHLPATREKVVRRVNFLSFLDHSHAKESEIDSIFRRFPWAFEGSMYRDLAKYCNLILSVHNGATDLSEQSVGVRAMEPVLLENWKEIRSLRKACKNVDSFFRMKSESLDSLEFGIPMQGRVYLDHYSWEPRNSDVAKSFGSLVDVRTLPFDVWASNAVISRNGQHSVVHFPIPCMTCESFSRQMYKRSFIKDNVWTTQYKCSRCVPMHEIYEDVLKFQNQNPFTQIFSPDANFRYETYKHATSRSEAMQLGMHKSDFLFLVECKFVEIIGKREKKQVVDAWVAFATHEEFAVLCNLEGTHFWGMWSNVPWIFHFHDKIYLRNLKRPARVSSREFFAQPLREKRKLQNSLVPTPKPNIFLHPKRKHVKVPVVCKPSDDFIQTRKFFSKQGFVFKMGDEGLGLYRDLGSTAFIHSATFQEKPGYEFKSGERGLGLYRNFKKCKPFIAISDAVVQSAHKPMREFSFDWTCNTPELVSEEFIESVFGPPDQPIIRSVCTTWMDIRSKVKCECFHKFKAWVRDRRGPPPSMPTFLCCGKSVFTTYSSFLDENKYARALDILDLTRFSLNYVDRFELLSCEEFLKLYFTLFSEGVRKASCLEEAWSWSNGSEKPSHCTLFPLPEKINYDEIRKICMQKCVAAHP